LGSLEHMGLLVLLFSQSSLATKLLCQLQEIKQEGNAIIVKIINHSQ
jgi:hypothetical protein